ncbi:MerR family transcriptional regulator [Cohnella soli]|uniref:MerR family transcriptional regulator n=1 Tax=Cohnella soli TaxID=425005 RepID=A0ABW0HTW3_9BACL
MKSEITISELARLMNVSVHQIRYFEEKGVLEPAYTSDNQYRMYGMDEIYRLSHILLLRKLGVPVGLLKECMDNYSADQSRHLLQHFLHDVEDELKRLEQLRQFIRKVLHEQQSYSSLSSPYAIKQRDAVHLARLVEMDPSANLGARQIVERARRVPHLFESDIHYVWDDSNRLTLYTETEAPGDLVMPEGEYLTLQRPADQDDEMDQMIEQFSNCAADQGYIIQGPMVLIEKSYLSLFSKHKLHYELQALISPTDRTCKEVRR